uniref:Uncharacterized protein n=1 Tax=Ixodes ricinus TaxID=34613 RepID=A0A0K8R3X3_IXORI
MGLQTPNTKQLKKKKNLHVLRTFQSCTHAKNWSANSPKTLMSLIQTRGALRSQRTHKYSGSPRDAIILGKKKNTSSSQRKTRTHTRQKKNCILSFGIVLQCRNCRKNLPQQEARIESSQRQREAKVGQFLGPP